VLVLVIQRDKRIATRLMVARFRSQSPTPPPLAYRLPTTTSASVVFKISNMRKRAHSSCWRSASITATIGDAVDIIPSTQAEERPVGPKRGRHVVGGWVGGMWRTSDGVRSGELSSKKMISQKILGSASATAVITPLILSRSFRVGTMTDSSAASTGRTPIIVTILGPMIIAQPSDGFA